MCRPAGSFAGPTCSSREDCGEDSCRHGEQHLTCDLSQKLTCFERVDSFDKGSEVSTPGPRSMGGYVPVTPLSATSYRSYDHPSHLEEFEGPSGRFLTECREDSFIGESVNLHLYDLNDTFGHLNSVSLDLLHFGGALHVGVEVLGNEWSFGMQGVSVSEPKQNQYYSYRTSAAMGRTFLKRKEVESAILCLKRGWAGSDYDIFARNCGHFCNELCEALGVGRMPPWVTRLAETLGELPGAPSLADAITRATIDPDALPGSPVHAANMILEGIEEDYDMPVPRGHEGLRHPGPHLPSASPVRCRYAGNEVPELQGNGGMPRARCEAFRVHEGNHRARGPTEGAGVNPKFCSDGSLVTDKYGGRLRPRQILFNAASGGG